MEKYIAEAVFRLEQHIETHHTIFLTEEEIKQFNDWKVEVLSNTDELPTEFEIYKFLVENYKRQIVKQPVNYKNITGFMYNNLEEELNWLDYVEEMAQQGLVYNPDKGDFERP